MAENRSSLVCPITFSLFRDPVSAEDGHTYERSAIVAWIQTNSTSPLTRELITIAGLRPNHVVRSLVDEFKTSLSKHNYKFKLGVDIDRCSKPFFHTTGKSVYEAKWIGNPNGPPIALLKLYGARAEKEASFYEHLTRHPHIVYTYGLVEHLSQRSRMSSDTSVMLLQEMALEGNLLDVLEHRVEKYPSQPFSDVLLNEIFLQITDAMIFLVDRGIIHGDLACRNILVFRIDEEDPKRTLVKLTDFGISRGTSLYSKIDAVATMIDTVPIRTSPPEVLDPDMNTSGDVYSQKSDMFSMGVLMREIHSNGEIPWSEITDMSVVRDRVIAGDRVSRPENCKSDRQWSLILKCMSQDPHDRPTFQDLKKQLAEPVSTSADLPEPASTTFDQPEPVTTIINSSEPARTTIDPSEPATTITNSPGPTRTTIDSPEPGTTIINSPEPASTTIDPSKPATTITNSPEPARTIIDPSELATIITDSPGPTTTTIDPPEPVTAITNSPEPLSSQSTSLPLRSRRTKPVKSKESERPQSCINVDETEAQLNCTYVPRSVKDRREFFEKQGRQQKVTPSETQSVARRQPALSGKPSSSERKIPQEHLIKLIKWH